jgi:hypothetical protein
MKVNGWCVPYSIFCATAWLIKQRQDVRIAVQKLDEENNEDHWQAEASILGSWVPLTEFFDGTSMCVQTWKRHYPDKPEPYKYLTLIEAEQEQWHLFKL